MGNKVGISLEADVTKFRKGLEDAVKITQGKVTDIADTIKKGTTAGTRSFETMARSVQTSSKSIGKSTQELTQIINEQKTITIEFERDLAALESKKASTSQTNLAAQKVLKDKIVAVKDAIKDQRLAIKELENERRQSTQGATQSYTAMNKAISGSNQLLGGATMAMGAFGGSAGAAGGFISRLQDGLQVIQSMNTFQSMGQGINGAQGGLKGLVSSLGGMKTIIGGLGIGMIIAGFTALADAVLGADDAIDEANASLKKTIELRQEFVDKVTKLNKSQEKVEIAKARQAGATEEQIYQIKVKWYKKNYDVQESNVIDEGKLWELAAEGEELKADHLDAIRAKENARAKDRAEEAKKIAEEARRAKVELAAKAIVGPLGMGDSLNKLPAWIDGQNKLGQAVAKSIPPFQSLEGVTSDLFTDNFPKAKEQLAALSAEMNKVTISGEMLAQSLETSFETMAVGLGEALGGALAGEAVNFGDVILKSMADFMSTIGKAIIATAIAVKAFRDQIIANPLAAVAAGIALVAGAAYINAKLKEGPKYAYGGIVPGSSNSGDHVPALVNSGEAIINKYQQKNMMAMLNSGRSGGGSMSFRVTPREIYMLWEEGKRQYGRG